jgi:hypothetical protein
MAQTERPRAMGIFRPLTRITKAARGVRVSFVGKVAVDKPKRSQKSEVESLPVDPHAHARRSEATS